MSLRAQLMEELRLWVQSCGQTKAEISARLGISQARVAELIRGKWDIFSIERLITLQ